MAGLIRKSAISVQKVDTMSRTPARVSLPPLPLTGGCQCGKVRFRLHGAPVVFYCCHCTECQKQSSSAFGESVRVHVADLETEGVPRTFVRPTASGSTLECSFCPDCGTRLFHRRDAYADTLNIKGGAFDDTSWLVPAGHIWTRSKQGFVSIPDDVLAYEEQPPDYDALAGRWRAMLG